MLKRFDLKYDPECPVEVPALLERVEATYFHHGGNERAFQSAAKGLCEMPHAAAAFLMAMAHLHAAKVTATVLPNATISSLASFTPEGARSTGHMLLDATAISSLELVEGSLGGIKGSLLSFLASGTATAAGQRRIREWICSPLYRQGDINERLDVVSAFMQLPEGLGAFQWALSHAPDCERVLPKVATLLAAICTSNDDKMDLDDEEFETEIETKKKWAGDVKNNSASMATLQVEESAAGSTAAITPARFLPAVRVFEGLGIMLEAVYTLKHAVDSHRIGGAMALPPLARALTHGAEVAEALSSLQQLFHPERFKADEEGLTLQPGICQKYDSASAEVVAARAALEKVEERERQALGQVHQGATPATLRKVILVEFAGEMVLEVPIIFKNSLSNEYSIVKETKTVVRVSIPDVAIAAERLAAAKAAREEAILNFLSQSADLFLSAYSSFLGFCSAVAALDALASFAEVTHPENAPSGCAFCRPTFTANANAGDHHPPSLHLHGLWNTQLLLAESTSKPQPTAGFAQGQWSRSRYNNNHTSSAAVAPIPNIQPNDLILGGPDAVSSTLLLTGANTGGKSTLLRSACLAVIMAQVGAYVPCTEATLAPVDRIFTRMGAQDRIVSGESTFCVEMTETAAVLRHAQRSSLVILDELGRGTSTHDGHAIAAAVAWWLTQTTQCRMLFATHYHALNHDANVLAAGAVLGHMESSVDDSGLVPSYQLMPGPAPQGSCGIAVAAKAGLPAGLVQQAQRMAKVLETQGKATGEDDKLEKLRCKVVQRLRCVAAGFEITCYSGYNPAVGSLTEMQAAVQEALLAT